MATEVVGFMSSIAGGITSEKKITKRYP